MTTGATDEPLKARLAACLKQGVIRTFAVCDVEPTREETVGSDAAGDEVVGIIPLAGDVAWSVMLGLPRETAHVLAFRFAGFEIEFDSPDMGDVVGEMANVLAGDLSARLERLGISVDLAPPAAARGHDVEVFYPENLPSLRMGFSCEAGPFWVKLVTAQGRRPAEGGSDHGYQGAHCG